MYWLIFDKDSKVKKTEKGYEYIAPTHCDCGLPNEWINFTASEMRACKFWECKKCEAKKKKWWRKWWRKWRKLSGK